MLMLWVWCALGLAGPLDDKVEEAKSALDPTEAQEEDPAVAARLDEIESAGRQQAARVVVLSHGDSDRGYADDQLVRNVKTRLGRPDAKFYPEIDLYQAGRQEPDRSIRPQDQRSSVSSDVISHIQRTAASVSSIPYDGLDEQSWGLKSVELRNLAEEIWFVDRPELRGPLFDLYASIGYSAENQNDSKPPFYEFVGGHTVNYYWYLAGTMAHEEPALLDRLTNQDQLVSVRLYKEMIDDELFPPMLLSFESAGEFKAERFAAEFELFINGRPETVTDKTGLLKQPPGRVDIYLKRKDGHSLSDRVELDKLQDRVYAVRDVARQRMGADLVKQLMFRPMDCQPNIDPASLQYLAIYGKLHPDAELYVAVPARANKIHVWIWVAREARLQRIEDETGGFPVRFAAKLSTGFIFSSASLPDTGLASFPEVGDVDPPTELNVGDPTASLPKPKFTPTGLPIGYELRGHYGRLVMGAGMVYAANLSAGEWNEVYQISDGDLQFIDDEQYVTTVHPDCVDTSEMSETDATWCSLNGEYEVKTPVLRSLKWQRLVYLNGGFVLGKQAAAGFGPRGQLQVGWVNAPHAIDITGRFGWAVQAPFAKKATGRVRPLIDGDAYAGVQVPFGRSAQQGQVLPVAGVTASVGLTF
jgi:hypothetical protein